MFLQRDPARYGDEIHLYQYVAGNPVGHADPSGKIDVVPIKNKKTKPKLPDKCPERSSREVEVKWDFTLDKPAPCDGYIVLQNDVRCTIIEDW
jgi:hypothetical protein